MRTYHALPTFSDILVFTTIVYNKEKRFAGGEN